MAEEIKVGIIGGSGMEDPAFIENYTPKEVTTDYGSPSSQLISGDISGIPIVIISRHGLKHSINPTNVNYRANIQALKNENCTHILAVTACGSLQEDIEPGHFVFPDQFIDRTTLRKNTFFDGTNVKHTPMANPFCAKIRNSLVRSCDELKFSYHSGKTVVTIEGPRFSTKAESHLFRSWGCHIINMSTLPEVVLANERNIKYQSIAMSTDYDCWHESEENVSMEMIYAVMKKNVANVKKLIQNVIPKLN